MRVKFLYLILIILLGSVFIYPYLNSKSFSNLTLPTTQVLKNTSQPSSNKKVPSFDHIVIITMENKSYEEILNNSSAPFLNSLIHQYGMASNYFALSHPSLPNYLALIGGSTFNITSDCTDCFISANNLIDELEKSHKSWKAYMESMPSSCFVGDLYPYAQKHDPFIYFNNIKNDPARCKNIVPFSQLSQDFNSGSSIPHFIWISPNLCSDMHDCSISQGDSWLSQQIPPILRSSAFTLQNSLLVITWDEGEGGKSNQVTTILIGPNIKAGFVSTKPYTHYSLLKTIEESWSLSSLTTNDVNAQSMNDFFN